MKTIEELKCEYFKTKTLKTIDKSLAAVKQGGYALQYVKEQTEKICLSAVEQNGDALRYVKIFD